MAGEGPAPPAESAFGSEGSGVEGEAGEVSVEKAGLEEGEGLGGVVPGPGRRRMMMATLARRDAPWGATPGMGGLALINRGDCWESETRAWRSRAVAGGVGGIGMCGF